MIKISPSLKLPSPKKKSASAHFAAVGSDGWRLVVWGVGSSEQAAKRDAARWEAPGDLTVHRITMKQRARIKAGEVAWPLDGTGVASP